MADPDSLFKAERRAILLSTGVVIVVSVVALLVVVSGRAALGLGLEAIGIAAAASLFVVGQRYAGLRGELAQAEAQLRYAVWVQEVVELLQSIDERLARLEEQKSPPA